MSAGHVKRLITARKLFIKPPPQKWGLRDDYVLFVRSFDRSFVRLSVACNAYCCWRRGLIMLAIIETAL